jgi:hypothetical protein
MTSDLDEKPRGFSIDEQDEPPINPWQEFVAGGNPMTTNSGLTIRHLEEAEERLFCTPEKMKFDILDILSRKASVFKQGTERTITCDR